MKYLIFLLFLLGVSQQGISQNVQDYYAYIQGLEGSGQSGAAAYLKGLYKNIAPTVYLEKDDIKFYGNTNPKRLISTAEDIPLNEKVMHFTSIANVELIVINYSPESDIRLIYFSPDFIQQLTSLQYIIFVPAFDVPIEKFDEIANHLNLPSNVNKLVRVSKGE